MTSELITFNVFGELRVTRRGVVVNANAVTRPGADIFSTTVHEIVEEEISQIKAEEKITAVFGAYVKPNGETLIVIQETGEVHAGKPLDNIPQAKEAVKKACADILKRSGIK